MCKINKKNIVLIGMSGCGKSTIGKILSKKLGFKYIDIDQYIEQKNGKTITELFINGEEYFRSLESEAIHDLREERTSVIATGGGVVKNYLNIKELKENGAIVFIDRCAENIAGDVEIANRPLLRDGVNKLYKLFNERYELYKEYCDFHVINDGSIEEVVERIIEVVN
jgi:shikimate kinase